MRKPVLLVSHQVIHKPSCSSRETRQRLEISHIETREIFLAPQIIVFYIFTRFNKAFLAPQIEYSTFFTHFNKAFLAPQIEYSTFFTHFNKAFLAPQIESSAFLPVSINVRFCYSIHSTVKPQKSTFNSYNLFFYRFVVIFNMKYHFLKIFHKKASFLTR